MQPEVTPKQQRQLIQTWLGTGSINIFGIQFAGKDTQAKRLASWTGGIVLGGGEVSRQLSSGLSAEALAITESGGLIPTHEYLRMITPYFARTEFDGRPIILSAVGRWHGEEDGVVQALRGSDHPLKAVILLTLDESAVWERWRRLHEANDRGLRADDSAEGLRKRLHEFATKTTEVLDYYRQMGLLIEVDGNQTPDAVEAAAVRSLYGLAIRPSG